jgi:hypothetical protein
VRDRERDFSSFHTVISLGPRAPSVYESQLFWLRHFRRGFFTHGQDWPNDDTSSPTVIPNPAVVMGFLNGSINVLYLVLACKRRGKKKKLPTPITEEAI